MCFHVLTLVHWHRLTLWFSVFIHCTLHPFPCIDPCFVNTCYFLLHSLATELLVQMQIYISLFYTLCFFGSSPSGFDTSQQPPRVVRSQSIGPNRQYHISRSTVTPEDKPVTFEGSNKPSPSKCTFYRTWVRKNHGLSLYRSTVISGVPIYRYYTHPCIYYIVSFTRNPNETCRGESARPL